MCDVCCEKFTYHNSNVGCQFCDFSACRSCHKTYVFGTGTEMHCMTCKKEWTDEYVSDQFTKSFYNRDLKGHREKFLLDHEKCLLPEAQECLGRYKKYKDILARLDVLKKERGDILAKHLKNNGRDTNWYRYNQIRNSIELWDGRLPRTKHLIVHDEYNTVQQHKWTWACPTEECRGFLNEDHTCGVCETKICKDCNEPHEEGHRCDEDTKKTIKMLKKDSKPCPKCSSVIHKIDGCDQMWCPDCKTAFSWQRGTVETTTLHNPHYYEYLRNTQGFVPRAQGDDPCRNDNEMPRIPRDDDYEYGEYFRVFAHAVYGIHQWTDVEVEEDELKFLRVQYLAGDLTEKQWKKRIQMRAKALRKRQEINQVFDAIKQVGLELFWDIDTPGYLIVKRARQALDYFNTAFAKISRRLGCMAPVFYTDEGNVSYSTMKYPSECQRPSRGVDI